MVGEHRERNRVAAGDGCIKENTENLNRGKEEGGALKHAGGEPERNKGELRAKRNLNERVFPGAGKVCQLNV